MTEPHIKIGVAGAAPAKRSAHERDSRAGARANFDAAAAGLDGNDAVTTPLFFAASPSRGSRPATAVERSGCGLDAGADHLDGAQGGERGTLLPGIDVADVVAGEVEGAVGLDQHLVPRIQSRSVAAEPADPGAQVPGHAAPAHVDAFLEFMAVSRMQLLDRGAGEV